jgi:seryl-tRNA(Sec) selenium transferase
MLVVAEKGREITRDQTENCQKGMTAARLETLFVSGHKLFDSSQSGLV